MFDWAVSIMQAGLAILWGVGLVHVIRTRRPLTVPPPKTI